MIGYSRMRLPGWEADRPEPDRPEPPASAAGKWVRADVMLPDEDTPVLAWCGGYAAVAMQRNKKWYTNEEWRKLLRTVSHWAPIEKPKTKVPFYPWDMTVFLDGRLIAQCSGTKCESGPFDRYSYSFSTDRTYTANQVAFSHDHAIFLHEVAEAGDAAQLVLVFPKGISPVESRAWIASFQFSCDRNNPMKIDSLDILGEGGLRVTL